MKEESQGDEDEVDGNVVTEGGLEIFLFIAHRFTTKSFCVSLSFRVEIFDIYGR